MPLLNLIKKDVGKASGREQPRGVSKMLAESLITSSFLVYNPKVTGSSPVPPTMLYGR